MLYIPENVDFNRLRSPSQTLGGLATQSGLFLGPSFLPVMELGCALSGKCMIKISILMKSHSFEKTSANILVMVITLILILFLVKSYCSFNSKIFRLAFKYLDKLCLCQG